MLLGKRPRPPMKRTTSLSEITLDLNTPTSADVPPLDLNNPAVNHQKPVGRAGAAGGGADGSWKPQNGLDQRVLATVSPRNHRRHSADFVETADFLRSCSLCRRRLVPSRDIYMYRGDSAFCSLECRQQQMNQDERKEKKCSVASKKQVMATAASSSAGSQVTSKGETVAAL